MLRLLKRHDPAHEVYWWLSSDLAPLLEGDPDLAGIIPFDRRRWASPWNWFELAQSIRHLRSMRFDLVLDLQGLLRSALVAWLSRGATTIGLDDPREGAPAFYDYAIPRPSPRTHAVDWYLRVLVRLHIPIRGDFAWIPPRPAVAARVTQQCQGHSFVVLHPGARWLNKRWPLEYFCALAKLFSTHRPPRRCVVLGGPGDAPLGRAIQQAAPDTVWDLTGRTSLPEMVEWIRLSQLVVTNDTGPMHVAAALRKRVVALFGPTDPRRTGPYGMLPDVLRFPLPCVPCGRARCANPVPMDCLWKITPETVAVAADKLLREPTLARPPGAFEKNHFPLEPAHYVL